MLQMNVLAALVVGLGSLLGYAETSRNPVTAIDVALEPDATMIQHAEAVNARLLKVFPKGFALDATHHPHITILQRYVRTADLAKVYAAAGEVLADVGAAGWKLKAFKYYYIPDQALGLAGIVVEPMDDLLELQRKLIEVVAPFTVKTGTAAAYVTTPEAPDISQPTHRGSGGSAQAPPARAALDASLRVRSRYPSSRRRSWRRSSSTPRGARWRAARGRRGGLGAGGAEGGRRRRGRRPRRCPRESERRSSPRPRGSRAAAGSRSSADGGAAWGCLPS